MNNIINTILELNLIVFQDIVHLKLGIILYAFLIKLYSTLIIFEKKSKQICKMNAWFLNIIIHFFKNQNFLEITLFNGYNLYEFIKTFFK